MCDTVCAIRHKAPEQTDPGALTHSVDSTAAYGIVQRKGAGPVKHLTVKQLWVQEVFRKYGNTMIKVPRHANVADMLCSVSNATDRARHLTTLRFAFTAHCPQV